MSEMETNPMSGRFVAAVVFAAVAVGIGRHGCADSGIRDVDVCVYAATPSGVLAAIAAKRAGRSVVVVEPSRWVGGILGAGLKPTQDCPNINATGGLTRNLLETLGHPNRQGGTLTKKEANTRLSLQDIREDFLKLLDENEIPVIYNHRIAACRKNGSTITEAVFERAPFDNLGCPVADAEQSESLRVVATIYIDAGYEGDLMARAGVSYRVGREAADKFNEQHAGVQPPRELAPIDPFVEPGNPKSGLLKWVEDDHGKPIGSADHYTQAYNYRYYTTDDSQHRVEITPPDDYDPWEFELVGRYVEWLTDTIDDEETLYARLSRIFPGTMNSGEWNYQRHSLFSMAPVGISQLYADGDYAQKARIWKAHQNYLSGLHHFMSTDQRVPKAFREKTARLGLDGRHHPETHGWPHQLYIRVSRRLAGRYTITAHDVYNRTTVNDPIGLAQYGIDTYPSRRIWLEQDGQIYVGLEGEMFVGGAKGPTNVPYPISYRAITPKADECTNLLVPICFSATHLGYASARMEPVFMIVGESAGIAASRAIAESVTVQEIDAVAYRQAMNDAGQVLEWKGTSVTKNVARPRGTKPTSYTFEGLLDGADTDGDRLVSRPEWSNAKNGYDWLFPIIDTGGDGHINAKEYEAFQLYKARNRDWRKQKSRKEH